MPRERREGAEGGERPPCAGLRGRAEGRAGKARRRLATRRTLAGGGWLATADIMTREIAEHTLKVTGGTLVEIRAVER